MRILFAGSPDVAATLLKDLLASPDIDIVGVLTNPPSPQGRSKALVPTPVAQATEEFNQQCNRCIPVLTPEKLNEEARNQVTALNPDILVCFAYGKIFGPKFLALFARGGINIHPSLLPKYRGCAPVPAAILNRDAQTGITVQRLAMQMDSGDILAQVRLPLDGTETADSLLAHCASLSGKIVIDVLKKIESGSDSAVAQNNDDATYCEMLKKEDGLIDWNKSALEIDAQIRAFFSWPGTFTNANGVPLRIHAATVYDTNTESSQNKPGTVLGTDKKSGILVQTGNGVLAITNLQWQAKKAMNWKDFMNGTRNFIGTVLI